jgi:hypothetical protein
MRTWMLALATTALVGMGAGAVSAQTVSVLTSTDTQLTLGQVAFEGGKTLNLTVGIGSGAYRAPSDAADMMWTVGDRGANFTCGDAKGVIGIEGEAFCGAKAKGGRIYPMPEYTPSIYRVQFDLAAKSFKVVATIPLKNTAGKQVSGLLNPLTVATTETPLDAKGQVLAQDPDAVDLEGLVQLPDGTFWLGEENGPSILHVAADGTILKRLVPKGSEGDYAKTGYPVEGKLPGILTKRNLNRGIESMAMDSSGAALWFVLQNPLANPDAKTFGDARNSRLLRFDLATQEITGEYVYELEAIASFKGEEKKKQSTPRISEMMGLEDGKLLLLDRTELTTHLLVLDPANATNILGTAWDDLATSPSLEQSELAAAGIVPVAKTLVLDTANHPDIPTKIEGLARMADGSLMMVNDNDFGIQDAETKLVHVSGLALGATPASK